MSSRSTSPSAEAWSATSATSVWRNRSACTAGSVVHASRNLCAGCSFRSSGNENVGASLTVDTGCGTCRVVRSLHVPVYEQEKLL